MLAVKTLPEIEAEITRLAAVLGVKRRGMLPTYGRSSDFAQPHIEVHRSGYHLVVVERGQELSRLTTPDLDEVLYQVFEGVTSELAGDYELAHRVEGIDGRRVWFPLQVELLGRLSDDWARRQAGEQATLLRRYPFDDHADKRADLSQQLRAAGHSPTAAWRAACERYPLPRAAGRRRSKNGALGDVPDGGGR